MKTISSKFDELMHRLQLDNAPVGGAFVVYKDGKRIISSCVGQSQHNKMWTTNTLSLNFSTSKGVLATLIHILVSKSILDYKKPIAEYWPEFGCNGKEDINLQQFLSHQTDLFKIDSLIEHSYEMQDWQTMISHVAAMPTSKKLISEIYTEAGSIKYSSTYNALLYGWILGGLIEKVTGLSLQEALDLYLAKPLGIVDEIFFKLPQDKLKDVAQPFRNFTKLSDTQINKNSNDNRNTDTGLAATQKSNRTNRKPILKPDSPKTLQSYQSMTAFKVWEECYNKHYHSSNQEPISQLTTMQINSLYFDAKLLHLPSYKSSLMADNNKNIDYYEDDFLLASLPAVNCIASANALAKIYTMLADKGRVNDDCSLLDIKTYQQITQVQTTGKDTVMPASLKTANNLDMAQADSMLWRLGYHRVFSLQDSLPDAFGHFGYNGSMAWCDTKNRLAVVYIHNYDCTMLTDIRQFALIEALVEEFM